MDTAMSQTLAVQVALRERNDGQAAITFRHGIVLKFDRIDRKQSMSSKHDFPIKYCRFTTISATLASISRKKYLRIIMKRLCQLWSNRRRESTAAKSFHRLDR
jgi:hypothetical protein